VQLTSAFCTCVSCFEAPTWRRGEVQGATSAQLLPRGAPNRSAASPRSGSGRACSPCACGGVCSCAGLARKGGCSCGTQSCTGGVQGHSFKARRFQRGSFTRGRPASPRPSLPWSHARQHARAAPQALTPS
jgi:hypothetical protein